MMLPQRIAASASNRSATRAPDQERDGGRGRAEDPDDADVREGQIEPVDVDEREQRAGRDEPAAEESLGQGDALEHWPGAHGADRLARRVGQRRGRQPMSGTRSRRASTPARPAQPARPPSDRQADRRERHRRRAATPAAAARPVPRNPITRPRIRPGYVAPQNRSWNGEPKEMLIQNTKATSDDDRGSGDEREGHERSRAERHAGGRTARVDCGPSRPAKTLSRLVRKGAADRTARPRGSRPPRRAIVGSRVDTSAPETP